MICATRATVMLNIFACRESPSNRRGREAGRQANGLAGVRRREYGLNGGGRSDDGDLLDADRGLEAAVVAVSRARDDLLVVSASLD